MTALGASQVRALEAMVEHGVSRHYGHRGYPEIRSIGWQDQAEPRMLRITVRWGEWVYIEERDEPPDDPWVSPAGTMTYAMVWALTEMVKHLPRPELAMDDVARNRHRRNRYSRTNRPLKAQADKLGVLGEMAFAYRVLGLMDYRPDASGPTQGYQFSVCAGVDGGPIGLKVQTTDTPGNLLVPEGKVKAGLYVLAGVNSQDYVFWCGWAWSTMVRQAEVKTMNRSGDYVLPSHAIPRDDLLPMAALYELIDAQGPDARDVRGSGNGTGGMGGVSGGAGGADDSVAGDGSSETQGRLFDW